ncbi:hypothetical protein ACQJ11_26860, partial [Klebsiella pneumoniae]|uniref:hypothetical protein n=1 Tax=Klebsiella pneumoniae TaxID=573 RepID=UPI003CFE0393
MEDTEVDTTEWIPFPDTTLFRSSPQHTVKIHHFDPELAVAALKIGQAHVLPPVTTPFTSSCPRVARKSGGEG